MSEHKKPKVLLDPHFRRIAEVFSASDLERLEGMAEVLWGKDEPMPPAEAVEALREATAVITTRWRYGENALNEAKNLRAIIDVSGSWPKVDYMQCYARAIHVLSCAPSFGPVVAEMMLGMAIAACREIVIGDADFRNRREKWLAEGNQTTFTLRAKPVGFIGFGGLAKSLLPLLAPFQCPVSVYHPSVSPSEIRRSGCQPVDLDSLLRTSRVIFVMVGPKPRYQQLLNRQRLSLIQSNAVLVLASRSLVVDFDALTEFVLEGRFKAAIDVFPTRPLPADHPIREARGAILSAHRAGSVAEALLDIGRDAVDDLEAVFMGASPHRLLQAKLERIYN